MFGAGHYHGDSDRPADEDETHVEVGQETEGGGVQEFLCVPLQQ